MNGKKRRIHIIFLGMLLKLLFKFELCNYKGKCYVWLKIVKYFRKCSAERAAGYLLFY